MPCTSLPSVDGTSTYLTPNMPFPPLFIGFEGFFFFSYSTCDHSNSMDTCYILRDVKDPGHE